MKKYNRSEIMARAWNIYREAMDGYKFTIATDGLAKLAVEKGCEDAIGLVAPTFANALKKAWAEAKANRGIEIGASVTFEDTLGKEKAGEVVAFEAGRVIVEFALPSGKLWRNKVDVAKVKVA